MPTHYAWWIAALVLIAAEMAIPGFFLMWIGVAAAVTGLVVMFMPALGGLAQAVLFVVLALALTLAFWRTSARWRRQLSANPTSLNRRGEQLIGQRFVLETAIEQGRGKARVGDSQWTAEGPDLPAGAVVEVIGVNGATLLVKPAAS